jgi:hypothetical protein
MTNFHDPHEPSPEFRAALKREVRRVYRAEIQFDEPLRRLGPSLGMMIGIAASMLVTLTLGLAVGASARYASAEGLTRIQRVATTPVSSSPSGLAMLKIPVKNALTALTCAASTAAAQTPTIPQQGVPIVSLAPVSAKTTTTLGAVLGVRELPGGRILVNDAGRKQIKVFDASLTTATIAQDSIPGLSNSYGPGNAQIIPFLGDSTLFTELLSRESLVLDHNGQVARALALPMYRDGDIPFDNPFPRPAGMDNKGRLLGEGGFRVRGDANGMGAVADSTLVYRADLQTREVDVVGTRHSSSGNKSRNDPPENGYRVVTTIVQPVPTEDSWTVLSDGTIAFVRGRDYHVDWVFPDGTKGSTDKLPFDWKRLTDEDKQHLIDSARVVKDSLVAIRNKRVNTPPAGRGDDPGAGGDGAGRTGRSGGGAASPTSGQQGSIQKIAFVPLSEIPDYYPPIGRNSAMPDRDGNLWILPTTSAQSQHGELVYDVVNPKRGLFQRVRMPLGRSIAGFGKGGVVYLQSGDRTNGFYIERAKIDVSK